MNRQEFRIEARRFLEGVFAFQKEVQFASEMLETNSEFSEADVEMDVIESKREFEEVKKAFFVPLSNVFTQNAKVQADYLGRAFCDVSEEQAKMLANDFFDDLEFMPMISSEDDIDVWCSRFGDFISETMKGSALALGSYEEEE